jgi:hypothetical protein
MRRTALTALVVAIVVSGLPVAAQLTDEFATHDAFRFALLKGAEEVPAISTLGVGKFALKFDYANGEIAYELAYAHLERVAAAHIHFGQRGANGGVLATLCSNVNTSATDDTPPCPHGEGGVRGRLTARDIVGPEGQGIAPEEMREAIRAIRAGLTYVNVHTEAFPSGEIRGQIFRRFPYLTSHDVDGSVLDDGTLAPGTVEMFMGGERGR